MSPNNSGLMQAEGNWEQPQHSLACCSPLQAAPGAETAARSSFSQHWHHQHCRNRGSGQGNCPCTHPTPLTMALGRMFGGHCALNKMWHHQILLFPIQQPGHFPHCPALPCGVSLELGSDWGVSPRSPGGSSVCGCAQRMLCPAPHALLAA